MTIKSFFRKMWVEEAIPKPLSKVIKSYTNDSPEVSFKQKIYYHNISPQIQLGVTAYARLLDLSNIQINSDNEKAKKIIDDWIDITDFRTKLDAMGNTFLICGNSILEKLDDKIIQDIEEVDMTTITGKKRDEYGKTLYYIQETGGEQKPLGQNNIKRYIEFNLNTISKSIWSPCIFESAAIPRRVGSRTTYPLVELVVGLEDAMSTIILNNAYPEVYYTFENANEDELNKQSEKIRKRKPGERIVTTKKPEIDMYESKGQSAYVDYIKYLYHSLSASIKFPVDIINGDFTSRASSETSDQFPEKVAANIKRYIGSKLKQELFDPILLQNGVNPKEVNLQATFGIQKTIELTPADVLQRFEKKEWSIEEVREWDKENTGVDLFDDDIMNNEVIQQKEDEMKAQFELSKKPIDDTKKEIESIHKNLESIETVLKTKIKSESAKEQILTEINKIQTKIELNTEEQTKKRLILENRQKDILEKIDREIKDV